MQTTQSVMPKPFTLAIGVLSGATLLSALGLGVASLVAGSEPVWALFGFEIVIVVGATFGLLTLRNASWRSSAMVFVCIAATIAVASILGHVGARGRLDVASRPDGVSLKPMLFARLGASLVIGGAGIIVGLGRSGRAWSGFIKGTLLALPFLLTLAAVAVARTVVLDAFSRMPNAAKAGLGAAVVLVVGISLCAGAHFLIRAFEMGLEDRRN